MNSAVKFLTLCITGSCASGLAAMELPPLDYSLGLSTSLKGSFQAVGNLPASQQLAQFIVQYRFQRFPWPWLYRNRPTLGLSFSTGTSSYEASGTFNKGNSYLLGVRSTWTFPLPWHRALCLEQRSWNLHWSPEVLLYSVLKAASYGKGAENSQFETASLTNWSGMGGWAMQTGLSRRFWIESPAVLLTLGASWMFRQERFQNKTDEVVTRVPSSGAVRRFKETRTGNYLMSTQSLIVDVSVRL